MIDDYLRILDERKAELPAGYDDVVDAARPVRTALDRNPRDLAPCHCDPLCENFLDSGERMWIVDWEYSGMNDPLWDLGDLSVEAGFTTAQDLELMRAYCAGEPAESDFGRMVIYKAMCDLLWTLWGLIQHSGGNPAEDFWAYSVGRFERCKALMSTAEFSGHVRAIGG
jgi:thiamine kinase-like enzyme